MQPDHMQSTNVHTVPEGTTRAESILFKPSFVQESLWIMHQFDPQSDLYNIYDAVRLQGPLDHGALARSIQCIVDRHEILRTTFVAVDGHPWQSIAPELPLPFAMVDLMSLPAEEARSHALQAMAAAIAHPFDLYVGPLVFVTLIQLEENDHVLTVTLHHTISDHLSSGIFWRELFTFYRAAIAGQTPVLPELPLQYADYAEWQREWLQGEALEEQLRYWRQQLTGAEFILELPTDAPRPVQFSHKGAHALFKLEKELSSAVHALAQREGVSHFMLLLAVFQTLMMRYSNQDTFVIGSPVAGRTRSELESLIGPFVNTLALRADLSGNPPFRELLKRVREICLGAYEHQDMPFEKLVEDLNPPRNLSYTPLFQVFFGLQQAAIPNQTQSTLTLHSMHQRATTAKADLGLTFTENNGQFFGDFEYCTDLFTETTMAGLIRHFETLLMGVVAEPNQRLSHLPLLTAAEREEVLAQGHRGLLPDPSPLTLPALVAAQVARTPDACALAWGAHTLTYAELFTRATQLARFLIRQGIVPGDRVGLAVPRSDDLIVGFLGILLAGAVYVPLDPTWPAARRAFVLADADLRLVLTAANSASDAVPVVDLTTAGSLIAQEDATPLPALAGPGALAYLIYTSGSTGQPKGVLVPQRGIGALAHAQIAAFGITPTSRVLQFAAPTFDAAIAEVVTSLLAGATLVLAEETVLHDPGALLDLLATARISVVTLPPALLATLPITPLPALQTLVVAGEVCPPATLLAWAAPGRTLINAYGPTEATVCATLAVIAGPAARLPLGRPLAHSEVYLLDAQLQPVPIGVPGEVYLAGLGLADGYLHQPALTAERFGPHPFSTTPGARLYRSGDRGRWLADGQVAYLGRGDTQVKLRGYRIELGEIESHLVQHPGVQAAAVRLDDQRLLAYVVSAGEPVAAEELTAFLGERVPAYMLPARYLAVAALPLTATGKLDRRALAGLAVEATAPAGGYLAPRTAVEAELAGIWEAVLGVAPISVDANFFALGGHSLLATQIIARVFDEFQLAIPLHTIFEEPTLAGFAEQIELHRTQQTAEPSTDEIPLTLGARYHGLTQ